MFNTNLVETGYGLEEVGIMYGNSELSEMISDAISKHMFYSNYDRAKGQWIDMDTAKQVIHRYRLTQLKKVLEYINNGGAIKDYRLWNNLNAFGWDILTFSNLGVKTEKAFGLKMVPVDNVDVETYSLSEMQEISNKIDYWRDDNMSISRGFIPQSYTTTSETMDYALIDNFIRGRVAHTSTTTAYISAVLNATLVKSELSNIFRIRYNSMEFVKEDVAAALKTIVSSAPKVEQSGEKGAENA